MRKLTLFTLLLLLAVPTFAAGPSAGTEEAGVRAAIQHYFDGHATGDGAHYRLAFQADSKISFMREGKFMAWTLDEFAGRASGKPAADEAQRKRSIDWIDVTGDAAVAKIRLEYPEVTFIDYMSLLKIDGEWKIVNKTFNADRKKK